MNHQKWELTKTTDYTITPTKLVDTECKLGILNLFKELKEGCKYNKGISNKKDQVNLNQIEHKEII